MNNITRYGALQRRLHWVVVVLVGSQYVLQAPMKAAMSSLQDDVQLTALDFLVTTLHTWGGAAIGAIMVYRLWLRWQNPVPVGNGRLHGLAGGVARGMHWGFYAVLMFMVASGTLHYYFDQHWVASWHERGEWLLLIMIAIHGLAAMLHHFWKKDDVLRQMWGSGPQH